jgi:hypothetical protein
MTPDQMLANFDRHSAVRTAREKARARARGQTERTGNGE